MKRPKHLFLAVVATTSITFFGCQKGTLNEVQPNKQSLVNNGKPKIDTTLIKYDNHIRPGYMNLTTIEVTTTMDIQVSNLSADNVTLGDVPITEYQTDYSPANKKHVNISFMTPKGNTYRFKYVWKNGLGVVDTIRMNNIGNGVINIR